MRSLKFKSYRSVFGTGFDIEKVYEEDGKILLYGENISTHPWKHREYSEQYIREIKQEELDEAIMKEKQIVEDYRRKHEEEKQRRLLRNEWIKELREAGLSVELSGWVTDDCGNPLFGLPDSLIGKSPNEVQEWIDEHYEEYVCYLD